MMLGRVDFVGVLCRNVIVRVGGARRVAHAGPVCHFLAAYHLTDTNVGPFAEPTARLLGLREVFGLGR